MDLSNIIILPNGIKLTGYEIANKFINNNIYELHYLFFNSRYILGKDYSIKDYLNEIPNIDSKDLYNSIIEYYETLKKNKCFIVGNDVLCKTTFHDTLGKEIDPPDLESHYNVINIDDDDDSIQVEELKKFIGKYSKENLYRALKEMGYEI